MTLYFEHAGNHTESVIDQVKKRLISKDISAIVVATNEGDTVEKLLNRIHNLENFDLQKCPIVAVTHQAGFRHPGEMEMSREIRQKLQSKGIEIVTATHALAGVDRAVRKKHGTWQISELIAETLRTFGQGTKVCAEIVLMAADAGVISMNKVIAIGGTGRGADTAWVIQPAHTNNYFDIKMQELLCKPINF